jgi:hypothetical protein
MTWAIGAGNPLGGYGIVLSDIQVTFSDDSTADILRKAYPVAPFLIGAFAGSVLVGFQLLEDISASLALPPDAPADGAWHPAYVAERWATNARAVFDRAADAQKELGCEFLLVGVDPVEDVIPGRARPYVFTFSAPEFGPRLLEKSDEAASIGSGNNVEHYVKALAEALSFRSRLIETEARTPGGWGSMLGFLMNRILVEHPVAGISQHIHIQTAAREGFVLANSDQNIHDGDNIIEIRMPRVAESYADLIAMANELRTDVATARA